MSRDLRAPDGDRPSLYDLPVRTLAGAGTTLAEHQGKTLLIVNVASRCGLTPQYEGLERLHERFQERGFSVLGFPCNQFLFQEPSSAEQIATFCSTTYGVSFPLYEKVHVKGRKQHPVYRLLSASVDDDGDSGNVRWNFEKFLVGRDGDVLRRFRPRTEPEDPRVLAAIEEAVGATR